MSRITRAFSTILSLCLILPALAQALTVNLAWDYTQGTEEAATGFKMERCTGATCTTFGVITPAGLPLTPLTYADTTVVFSTTYRYQIRAIGAQGGVSGPSNIINVTTPAAVIDVPANLRGSVVR